MVASVKGGWSGYPSGPCRSARSGRMRCRYPGDAARAGREGAPVPPSRAPSGRPPRGRNRFERTDLLAEPGEDVVTANALGEPLDSPAPVVLVQLERELEVARHALDVERVAGKRLAQLLGGARELAEHEHAGSPERVLAHDELLADEVHAVAERRHHAHVGDAVVREELPRPHAAVEIVDGNVVAGCREAAVDPADDLLDLGAERAVLADVAAARHS